MQDTNLISQWFHEARQGNKACFNNLIAFYHAKLLSYAMKVCHFSNIAEDALQDAYINAFIHFNEVKEAGSFFFWLRTIVRRSCWQQLNSGKKTIPLSANLIDAKISDNSFESKLEKNNISDFLWERISRLSEPLRIVILLRYFNAYHEYETIAEILGIPVGTVRSRLNEAKRQLKKIWDADLSEMPTDIKREAEYWNEFYEHSFETLQHDEVIRKNFTNHLMPDLTISYTSGKAAQGRILIEREFDEDLKYGTAYKLGSIFNLKDIGIIQGENINSSEYPDRCPPTSTLIFHRKTDKTFHLQFHNAFEYKFEQQVKAGNYS